MVAIDLASLNALMTQTLADDNSNVDKLKISVDDKGDLRQKGVIDKAVNIPFNVKAGIEATPDGKLRVFTKSVKGFGVPMKPLMKMFQHRDGRSPQGEARPRRRRARQRL